MKSSELIPIIRRLVHGWRVSLSVIAMLSLGIGATVAVFSIVYAVILRPIPYPDPGRIVSVFYTNSPNDTSELEDWAPQNFFDLQEQTHSFEDLAASCGFHYNLITEHEWPEQIEGAAISPNLFKVLGVRPKLGRDFSTEDDNYSAQHVVIISSRLWSRRFNGDPSIIGKVINLNGMAFSIVGVVPFGFHPMDEPYTDLWIPLRQQVRPDRILARGSQYLELVGRLRREATLPRVRADVNQVVSELHRKYPTEVRGAGAAILSLQDVIVGPLKGSLLIALATVVFVLLIATTNVAILTIAKINSRRQEFALRIALGCGKSHIVRDILIESVILGLFSGALGLLVCFMASRVLFVFVPQHPILASIEFNSTILIATVLISVSSAFIFGIAPAFIAMKIEVHPVLRAGGNTTTLSYSGRRIRNALLVCEVSLSVALLIGTGMMFRAMVRLEKQPLGFEWKGLETAWIGLPRIRYQNDQDAGRFFSEVKQRLSTVPAIQEVALAYPLPLGGVRFWTSFNIPGDDPAVSKAAALRLIDSNFLSIFQISILKGRAFTEADDSDGEPVAIISESFARQYWPMEDSLGKSIVIKQGPAVPRRIVGIIADVKAEIQKEPVPAMYIPYKQAPFPSMQVVMKLRDTSTSVEEVVRKVIQGVDPGQPVQGIAMMDSIVSDVLEPWKFALFLLCSLSGLAVLLTGFGQFAVFAYFVRERRRELGIRMALGASRRKIKLLVLLNSARLALIGAMVGIVVTIAALQIVSTSIYDLHTHDWVVYVVVSVFTTLTSLVAAYIPSSNAANMDPFVALRDD